MSDPCSDDCVGVVGGPERLTQTHVDDVEYTGESAEAGGQFCVQCGTVPEHLRGTARLATATMVSQVKHVCPDETPIPELPVAARRRRTCGVLGFPSKPWRVGVVMGAASLVIAGVAATVTYMWPPDPVQVALGSPTLGTGQAAEQHVARPTRQPGEQTEPTHGVSGQSEPAKVHNFPVLCPGSSDIELTDMVLSSQPMTPVELCAQQGLLGDVPRERAMAISTGNGISVTSPEVLASKTFGMLPAGSAKKSISELPPGWTYSSADFEMRFAVPRTTTNEGGCVPYAQLKANAAAVVQKVTGGTWRVQEATVQGREGGHASCHSAIVEMADRTLYLAKVPGGDEATAPMPQRLVDRVRGLESVQARVNGKCFTAREASSEAQQAMTAVKDPISRERTLVYSSSTECARWYPDSLFGVSAVIFGR